MATTNSSNVVQYANQQGYDPVIIRAAAAAATSSGGSYLSTIMDTHKYSYARVTLFPKAIGAATTVTVEVLTGATSSAAAVVQHCFSSSGSTNLANATTVASRRVFRGLNRWSRLAYYCNGTNASTDLSIDVELV